MLKMPAGFNMVEVVVFPISQKGLSLFQANHNFPCKIKYIITGTNNISNPKPRLLVLPEKFTILDDQLATLVSWVRILADQLPRARLQYCCQVEDLGNQMHQHFSQG